MKKLAIVSSYAESCGNAAFTKILHDSIEKYTDIEVEVLELNLTLLQSIDRKIRRSADAHIADLCKQLKNFDLVNIQMEAGLFGTLPRDIKKRVQMLISANKNITITMHSPRLISSSASARDAIKQILSLKIISGVKALLNSLKGNLHVNINRKIINAAISKKCRFIVHTRRAKNQIETMFGYNNTDIHPLKFVPDNFQVDSSTLQNIRKELNLPDDAVVVGMFGYISPYKGHLDALEALKFLPDNHYLLIFGRQHPQTLRTDGKIDGYLDKLQKKIIEKELTKRVFFLGELNDNDFMQVAANVDVAWLPYYENGQDGSGIASICVDACPRVLCSSSFAFDELFKLAPSNNVMRFDIGNALEIATKTQMIMRKEKPLPPHSDNTKYSIKSQALVYAKELAV